MSNSSVEDTATIARLETEAAKLRAQLDAGFAKRPLIIEFSGLPKSGKTRSIGILELFLKRNGFKVDVFIERAFDCADSHKGAPELQYLGLLRQPSGHA